MWCALNRDKVFFLCKLINKTSILKEYITCGVNVVCTQPRRVSATSLASRVAEEIGTTAPGSKQFVFVVVVANTLE